MDIKLPSLPALSAKFLQIPYRTRVTALGVSASFALIGLIVALIKRNRQDKEKNEKEKKRTEVQRERERTGRIPLSSSPNGDLPYRSRSPSSIRSLLRQKSLSGSTGSLGAASVSTTSTIIHPTAVDTSDMSSQELCQLGLDTLQLAITYWEDAVMKMGYLDDNPIPAITDPETSALQHHLERLLEMAYHMQDSYERQMEKEADYVAFDTAMAAFAETENMAKNRSLSIGSSSDLDSFVSATDLADLSDLDTHREMFKHLVLYEAGLLELKHGTISCRTLRTEMSQCMSDTEFLAKLHCIRLALEDVFKDVQNRDYFSSMGRKIIGDLLLQSDRDPEDFYAAYTSMMDYVNNADNWSKMEDELRGRGVKNFTFYDVVLDFILMDAFDDLENPPSSVIAVCNNRWLSNGFKETALSTAVWSVLKAKRRLLKYPNGFINHFYNISESVSPVLAWGFLGPESKLKDICSYFKEIVLGFIRDMFSFEKARYTGIEELSEDIVKLAKLRMELVLQKLNPEPV
ncbi:mitoguardin-like [Mercenaria mercenaria]|uniref:mitoguardin-like n=1 Tax=Mercenaria mercenaria TaxID=6596 RepID=UPI001E1D4837|nr:mitoguardin-like [Mercenaria mercenaria]